MRPLIPLTTSRKFTLLKTGALVLMMAGMVPRAWAADSPPGDANIGRERLLIDSGWKFHLGELGFEENIINAGVNRGPAGVKFNDAKWRTVNLPHDWGVELPFDAEADGSHGYKAFGPGMPGNNNVGWYRREFILSKVDKGKRLWLEFGGVYRDCRVFLNGYRLIHHEGGYNSFRCDITDVAHYGGKNVVAVRVDASENEGWFYEGAGIYRHVWLVKTAPVAIAPDGIFVYTTFPNNVPAGDATVHLQAQLHDWSTNGTDVTVHWQILDPVGNTVAAADATATLIADGQKAVEQTATVPAPILWTPETPHLYKLVTTVESSGQVIDREETAFGIRTLAFDADNGFLLNGQHYAIHGTCNHQDHAGVGSALPDALQYFRVSKLKEMGCNALRTTHNEPTAELLDACDRLGLLVLDETRNFASNPQALANLEQQIRRDRNHPSVFIWSLGNEEPLQRTEADAAIANTMRQLAHRLDPTRFCTFAMSSWSSGEPDGISLGVDVQGFNYFRNADMDAFHKANPRQVSIGTEEGSDFYTRGVYAKTSNYESAYDEEYNGNGA
ncbi:MAG TPA: glycoside hydrolase family 2 TIM barrel-domain containing protein, partial [Verrucomicrobiae bacterium]